MPKPRQALPLEAPCAPSARSPAAPPSAPAGSPPRQRPQDPPAKSAGASGRCACAQAPRRPNPDPLPGKARAARPRARAARSRGRRDTRPRAARPRAAAPRGFPPAPPCARSQADPDLREPGRAGHRIPLDGLVFLVEEVLSPQRHLHRLLAHVPLPAQRGVEDAVVPVLGAIAVLSAVGLRVLERP